MNNKEKHILILSNSYPSEDFFDESSYAEFLRDFAVELSKITKVSVINPNLYKYERSEKIERGVNVIRFRWKGLNKLKYELHPIKDFGLLLSYIYLGIKETLRFVKREKVDFILCCWAVPSGIWVYPAKLLKNIPYGVWALGSDIWHYGTKPITKNIVRFILKNANEIFADGFDFIEQIRVISGRESLYLSSTRKLPDTAPANAEMVEGKKNYLFIGRYHANKGPDILLQAITFLDEKIRFNCHFHFFGSGQKENEMIEFIKENNLNDIVTLHGFAHAVTASAYLRACEALVIPSRIESIPVILSDALQCDCPVIVTDVGDMGKLVRKYNAGYVSDSISPNDLAAVISNEFINGSENFRKGRGELYKMFDLEENAKFFIDKIFQIFNIK